MSDLSKIFQLKKAHKGLYQKVELKVSQNKICYFKLADALFYAEFFCSYNYGIMRSRPEQKYILHTKIAWNVFYHITDDSKVEEHISMCINKYKAGAG